MTIKQLALIIPVLAICFFHKNRASAQCPTLSQNSTLDPCGGQQPCDLCPGDVLTMTTTGTNIKAGACIKWYMGTTPNFNPYNNVGNYLGCSEVALAPPNSCADCPQNVGIFVDACGAEPANEFMLITSGSGFYVDDMVVDFDDSNNIGPSDADINDGSCPWGTPSAATVAAIQAACPGATVVGAGPGDIVPEGVLVMILTSAGFNFGYNWGGLCPLISTIYVMQNSCSRANQAFQNGGLPISQSTTVSLACGCSDVSTYDCTQLVGGNGAFYSDYLFPIYLNAGCGIPGAPIGLPPTPPPALEIPPLDTTLWAGLCNGGPYYVVGIYTPLPAGCPQVFTNYMQFNVVCPTPMLTPGATCNSTNNFNLDDLVDPNHPTGVWSGANVAGGNTFNAMGLPPGNYNVSFDPDGDCALNATTTVTVSQAPKATLTSGSASVCAGQAVNLTITFVGTGPFDFTYSANGIAQNQITATTSPYILTVNPTVNTVYSLTEMNDINCTGTVLGVFSVTTQPAPTAAISGNATICSGQSTNLFIDFGGSGPWTFSYSADGVIIDTLTTSKDPDTLAVSPTDTTVFKIIKIWNADCFSLPTATATVNVPPAATAVMSGSTAVCGAGQLVDLTVDFTGTGPWTFVYSINTVAQPPITTALDPYILNVTPTVTTSYALQSVSAGNCPGQVSGGATITVATPPMANLTGNVAVCPGQPAQLSVNFMNGAAPWTFVYSAAGVDQTAITTSNDPYLLVVNPAVTTTYSMVSVASGTCTGAASGSVTVNVGPPLPANISGTATINLGQNSTLVLNVPGAAAGATIVYQISANGTPLPPISTTTNPFNFVVMPTVSTTYVITGCTVNGCPATPSGSALITVQNNFSATISNDTTICNGGTANLLVEFSAGATGPFTFVFAKDGVNQPPVTTISNPHILPVMPSADAVYTLINVVDGTGTAGTFGGSATVTVNAPMLLFSPQNLPLCFGTDGVLTLNLTGANPPFDFIYEINGAAQPAANSPTASFQIPVTASLPTVYELISGQAGGCPVNISTPISATVQVVGPPQPNNIQVNCNLAAGNYTVSFEVATQPLPAGNVLVDGTPVSGTVFTSAPILVTNDYTFNLTNGCGQFTVAGQNTCACITDAGTMTFLDTLEVCIGGQVAASHENDEVTEPGDVFEYILHTQPSIPVGGVLAVNPASPTFSFNPATMAAGQVYYISAIAGNDDGTGHVSLTDPCLSVATGTPVQFFDPPTMTVEVADTTVCEGDTVKILIKLNGNGPFNFTFTKNGLSQPLVTTTKNVAVDSFIITAVLQQATTFQVTTFSDATCAGILPTPVTIQVNGIPTLLTQPVTACDLTTFTYTVSCTVQGGNQNYLFSGGGGSFTGAFFESAPIPIGTPFNYVLGDTEQCGFVNISGNPNCSCVTNAGQYPFSQPLVFCNGAAAQLPLIPGSVLEPDDTLIYILHTLGGPNPQLWTILGTNDVPFFNFNAGLMNVDSTYFISAIAGNLTPVGIDLGDPCLSVSTGIPVSWLPPVTAFLGGNLEICAGDTAHLTIVFSGNDAPYSFTFLENSVPQPPLVSPTDTFYLNVSPSLSANYSLFTVNGATCPGSFNGGGGAAVSVLTHPDIVEFAQSCDFQNMTYSIFFKISNGADTAKTFTVSGTPGTLASDSVFTSAPIPFGTPFSFLIKNLIGCDTLLTGLGQCNCTSNAGTMDLKKIDGCIGSSVFPKHNGDQALDPDDAPLTFILFSDPADPLGSILQTGNFPPISFDFDQNSMFADTTYFISTIAGNLGTGGAVDFSDPCLSVSPPVELVWHELPTAVISGNAKVCANEMSTVQIQFTGTGPWNFVYKLNGISTPGVSAQPVFNIATTPQVNQNFSLVSVFDQFCAGSVSGSALVEVQQSPTGFLVGPASVCPGFPAKLLLQLIGGTTYDVSISGSNGWDTTILGATNGLQFFVQPTGAGPVSYQITSLTSPQTPCFFVQTPPIFIEIKDISESLTLSQFGAFNISCPGANDGTVEVSASGGQPPYTFIWNTGSTSKKITDLAQGWYQVTVTDAGGCIDSVYALLFEPPPVVFDWRSETAACFGGQEGTLTVESVIGGIAPYKISVNGGLALTTNSFPVVFSNMSAGVYDVEIIDGNGCKTNGQASVDAANELIVELGPDIYLPLGDSVLLEGLVNYPVDTAWFSPIKFLETPDSIASWSRPLNTMRYQLTVKDANGCTATDFILVEVDATRHVFVPNAFFPEREGPNGTVAVFGGHDVAEITSFQIFDRWGDLVHEALEFEPNDLTKGWNGKSVGGKKASPGVYVYWLKVLFADGSTALYKGDITLVR